MATPKKLPSGQWRARGHYKDPVTGKIERPSFTAPTKAEAARMVAEWEAQKTRQTSNRDMTVGDCIEKYISSKESVLSPSTLREYRKAQKMQYKSIENIPLSRLSDVDLQSFVSELSRRLAPKTVRNHYGLLISAVSMFSDRHYHVTLPTIPPKQYHLPTDDDVTSLLRKASVDLRKCIALAAIGTIRRGEIVALKYRDIDHDNSTILVHADIVQDLSGEWVYKNIPKTAASTRLIPFPPQVIEMLGTGDPDEYVIKHNPSYISAEFHQLRDKLGLECRFHDLRHYAASVMHALGIPDQYIMERGGWSSDKVLKSVYRNTISDRAAQFADVANNHFKTIL